MAKTINKHGLTIKGLRKASGDTGVCPGSSYSQIFYDLADGQVWERYNYTSNNWTTYHSNTIIAVCSTRKHMTMQEIADAVAEAVARDKAERAEMEAYYARYCN